jgi:hypothetical protein
MNEVAKFMIATDDDGEEYTSLIALVIERNVELTPFFCDGDTPTSITNRAEAFLGRFESHPSDRKYLGIVRLYRTGEAKADSTLEAITSSVFGPRCQKLALQTAEALYDQIWPVVGEFSEQFVRDTVLAIRSRDSVNRNSRVQEAVERGAIGPWIQSTSMGELLRKLLFEEEKQLLANRAMTQKIGFLTNYGAAMMVAYVPYEKYRWGRAVAEIARKVNALEIVQITGGFLRDAESGERNGQECLWGLVIKPDGSIKASAQGVYARENGELRVSQEITVAETSVEKQFLIPAWGADNESA